MKFSPGSILNPGVRRAILAAVGIIVALGIAVFWLDWFPRAFAPTAAPGGGPGGADMASGTPPATISPSPPPSPSSAIPYTGAAIEDLRADPAVVAQVSQAAYQKTRAELADLATRLAVNPNQPALWMRVASIKHFYNDDLGARDAYEYVNRIAPADAVAFYNLALIYGYNLKEPARAKPKFEAAIRLNPQNPSFSVGFANFYREVARDNAAAERVLLDGFAKVPTDVSITSNLGALYRDRGNVPKAIEFYEKTLASRDLSAGERAAIQAEVDALRVKQAGG